MSGGDPVAVVIYSRGILSFALPAAGTSLMIITNKADIWGDSEMVL
jgi:hypothetical protein